MSETYIKDAEGRQIHIPFNPRRIDGLVAEDKARTLTLFRPGNYAEHPTDPIDIAPFHDALQGLGTHVKSILQNKSTQKSKGLTSGSLELASTLELMRLNGYYRYMILAYELDGDIEISGKTYKVRRYHTAIEAIFSPETFAMLRGKYTLEHLAWIQRRLDAYDPTLDTIKYQQERFKRLMSEFSRFFGIATPSVKLSINSKNGKVDNKRVQSSISLHRVQQQLSKEGPYHGRFIQPNYREYYEGETFYGMKLPWFTINKDHIYSTIGDPKAAMDDRALKEMQKRSKVRKKKRIVTPPAVLISNKDEQYANEEPMSIALLTFNGGMLSIVRQQDQARTVSIEAVDAIIYQHAQNTCKQISTTWLPICGRWLMNYEQAKKLVKALGAIQPANLPPPEEDYTDPIPRAPEKNPLRPNPKNDRLFFFDVGTKTASVYKMKPHGNWVILDQGDKELAEQIANACTPYAPLKPWDGQHNGNWTVRYNAERESWIVREEPENLIQRVVSAIQKWKA